MRTLRLLAWTVLMAAWLPPDGRPQDALPPRLDRHGDPLPPGAIARLWSARFRHSGSVRGVAFSPDGTLLAASSDDKDVVVVWDRATGKAVSRIPFPHDSGPPDDLRFSPDGRRLYTSFPAGSEPPVFAWDPRTGAELKAVPRPPTAARVLAFPPGGRDAVLLRREAELVRWDLEAGRELARGTVPAAPQKTAARVGDRLLAAGFNGREVVVWDAGRGEQLWSVPATRDKHRPWLAMAFSPDGTLFAVEAEPRAVAVYDAPTGRLVRSLAGRGDNIYHSLAFSPDNRTVAGVIGTRQSGCGA